ncbi:hypothetical protein AGMMS50230_15960 [Spirochaetia bacterium]|nr:hypothetical protein AGMMS50230_15960 [Spirochaetia bacterium]
MITHEIRKLHVFAAALAELVKYSLVAPDRTLRWTIIANPGAGGFTIHRRWKKHEAALAAALETVRRNPGNPGYPLKRNPGYPLKRNPRKDAAPSDYSQSLAEQKSGSLGTFGLIPTNGPGHAVTITEALLKEAAGNDHFYLFITAGGDGTSLEVLQAIYHAPPTFRSRCAILRLPLGTGNDGAETWELENALKLLVNPTHIELTRGIKLSTASGKTWPASRSSEIAGKPFLAFNILSVGLDAFVTHMTNRMKGKLPGDSYKLWVDIAALLYDRIYKVGPMEIKVYDEKGKELKTIKEKILLCAMGASGHRSYGSHKMILPDDRNVCAVKQMPLFRKIALKGLFTTGEHITKPESFLFTASRLLLTGMYPILAQMDGETVRLEKEDFPALIELTEAVIPVLRAL